MFSMHARVMSDNKFDEWFRMKNLIKFMIFSDNVEHTQSVLVSF